MISFGKFSCEGITGCGTSSETSDKETGDERVSTISSRQGKQDDRAEGCSTSSVQLTTDNQPKYTKPKVNKSLRIRIIL